jgi:hypothetical protein
MLESPASNTHGFLLIHACVSSTQLNRPIWNKESLSPPWKTKNAGRIPIKNWLNSHMETRSCMMQLVTYVVFFEWYMGFFNSAKLAKLELRESISSFKNLSTSKFSFQNLTSFSQGNTVLDAPDSNTNVFFSIHTCVSSTLLNSCIWNKESLSPPENHKLQKVRLSETNSILTG